MTFGARVLKTGIAVTLALYASAFFHFTPGIIAAVSAVFAMQPTIYRSWHYLREQLQSNTVGAALAMLAGLIFPNEPIIIGLVCIIVIMICLKFRMGDTIGLTLVTVIAVMDVSSHWPFALNRFLQSLIGIGCASLLNIAFYPPNPNKQFEQLAENIFQKMSVLLRTAISDELKESVYRDEKRDLVQSIRDLEGKFKLLEEEQQKLRLKVKGFSKGRLLVVYKQMLAALHKGAEILDATEEHYFPAARNEQAGPFIDRHLEELIKYHEVALLAFEHKIKPGTDVYARMDKDNEAFLRLVTDSYASGQEDSRLRLVVVASAIYEYGHQLGRLDKLVEQYHKGSGG